MKCRAEYTKLGMIRYISHLDLVRLFERALERGKIPVLYSDGYNPHPKFSLGNPLSLGVESESEFLEIQLEDDYPPENLAKDLNPHLPQGIQIKNILTDFPKKSIQQSVASCLYVFDLPDDQVNLAQVFETFTDFPILRRRKKGRKKIIVEENAMDWIYSLRQEGSTLYGHFSSQEGKTLRPDSFLKAFDKKYPLGWDLDEVNVKRVINYDPEGREFHGK